MAPTQEITGVALIAAGVQCSVLANSAVKLLAGVPMLQIMQFRFLLQWICSMSMCLALKFSGHDISILGPPGCRLILLLRASTYTGALMSLWCALRYLPVGEATAIVYLNPILCGLIAHFLLREPLGRIFWGQATISCIGVALVANIGRVFDGAVDTREGMEFGGKGLAFIACLCFATGNCVVRLMPRCHPIEVQVFTDSTIALIAMPAALFISGSDIDVGVWTDSRAVLLVVFTAFGLGTSFLAITGFKMAPATIAALFMYLEVPSSFAVQVFFFDQVPGASAVFGAMLITVAALTRLVYEASQSHEDTVDEKMYASPDSLDLNDDDFAPRKRQVTLTDCLGPCILARQASIPPYKPFLRNQTEEPSSSLLFSPRGPSQRQATF